MDESFVCDCGCQDFWPFEKQTFVLRCKECFAEYRMTRKRPKRVLKREFNKDTHSYPRWRLVANDIHNDNQM